MTTSTSTHSSTATSQTTAAVHAEPDHDVIELLARKLCLFQRTQRWIGQSIWIWRWDITYRVSTYRITTPQHPPLHPGTHHHPLQRDTDAPGPATTPNHAWYNPPTSPPHVPSAPPFCPYCPPPKRARTPPPFEKTRRSRDCKHVPTVSTQQTRTTHIGPPLYVPPALRGQPVGTSHKSKQPNSHHSGGLERPTTPIRTSQLEGLKNARTAQTGAHPVPNCPITFRSPPATPQPPTPPANSPPTSPTHLFSPRDTPWQLHKHHPRGPNSAPNSLPSSRPLSNALQGIALVAEKADTSGPTQSAA